MTEFEELKQKRLSTDDGVNSGEVALLGAIVRQAVVDYCFVSKRKRPEQELDRKTAELFLKESPLMEMMGLNLEYLVEAYKRDSLKGKKCRNENTDF